MVLWAIFQEFYEGKSHLYIHSSREARDSKKGGIDNQESFALKSALEIASTTILELLKMIMNEYLEKKKFHSMENGVGQNVNFFNQ